MHEKIFTMKLLNIKYAMVSDTTLLNNNKIDAKMKEELYLKCWGRRASDKMVTFKCRLLDKIIRGD